MLMLTRGSRRRCRIEAVDERERSAEKTDHEGEREVEGGEGREEEAQEEKGEGFDEEVLLGWLYGG